MSGQNAYLVAYDIASSPGRLKRIHRLMCGYGDPLQYSVFHCKLNRKLHQCLLADLHEVLDLQVDRVMIVDLGPVPGRGKQAITFLGRDTAPPEQGPMIF